LLQVSDSHALESVAPSGAAALVDRAPLEEARSRARDLLPAAIV